MGTRLLRAQFVTSSAGWIVGSDGTVLYTGDGGATWSGRSPKTIEWLGGLSFVDELHGWTIGSSGGIFQTADGGLSWTRQNSGTNEYLKDVFFSDLNSGWVVGHSGLILHTTNGGATWSRQSAPIASNLNGVEFSSAATGWIAGDGGTILSTGDGGATWTQQTSLFSGDLYDVSFFGPASGCLAGPPGIICTNDGGATWPVRYEKSSGYANLDYMNGVHILPGGTGWAVGEDGFILRTINGGVTWEVQQYGTAALFGIAAISGNTAIAVGNSGNIRKTTNGGADWNPFNDESGRNLTAVDFLSDGATGWAVGYAGRMLHTVNGGADWVESYPHNISGYLNGVDFANALHGFAVGDGGVILSTSNGGADWDLKTYSLSEFHRLNEVDFVEDSLAGWIVGDGGTVLRTVNGVDWAPAGPGQNYDFSGVSAIDGQNAWIVGGAVFHTTDGGQNWTQQTAPGGGALNSVIFLDANTGWAVGDAGLIMHTVDGGDHWTAQEWLAPNYSYPDLYDVWFTDANNGWAVGVPFSSLMLHTNNGGATWTVQSHGSPETLEGVVFSDANNGWAVGWRGSILHFSGPLETTPPQTTANGVPAWTNTDFNIDLTATDGSGTGIAWSVYNLDGGSNHFGSIIEYAVDPVDHAADGTHTLGFFSIDNAGNREAQQSATFGIDTRPPKTVGVDTVEVKRGKNVQLPYKVKDAAPNGGTATAVLTIRNAKGNVVKQFDLGTVPVNRRLTQKFRCKLPKGSYRYQVRAVDTAGNEQSSERSGWLIVN